MDKKYTPQVTSQRSFEYQEQEIYKAFLSDYGHEGADAVAKSSTAFALRYMNAEEVLTCLIKAGISPHRAQGIVLAFAEARAKAEALRSLRGSRVVSDPIAYHRSSAQPS